jgi:integrase
MGARVREVHGSWYVFINHQGKRKAKKIGPGPDGKRVADEAARLIAARLSLGDLGVLQEPEPRETFAAFAEAWLDGYARSLKRRTQENYRQVLRAHWIPTLGNLELADIGREEIRVVVTQQMRHGLQISTIRTNLQ